MDAFSLEQNYGGRTAKEDIKMKENNAKTTLYFSTIIVILIILFVPNKYIKGAVAIGFALGSTIFLYKNITLLTGIQKDSAKQRPLKKALIFCFTAMAAAILGVILKEKELFTPRTEELFAHGFILMILLWFGSIAAQIPFNRYVGLRLPWMLNDEETWNLGHRVLWYSSLPLAAVCLALIPFIHSKLLPMAVILSWIAIPGIVSYLFFRKKYK